MGSEYPILNINASLICSWREREEKLASRSLHSLTTAPSCGRGCAAAIGLYSHMITHKHWLLIRQLDGRFLQHDSVLRSTENRLLSEPEYFNPFAVHDKTISSWRYSSCVPVIIPSLSNVLLLSLNTLNCTMTTYSRSVQHTARGPQSGPPGVSIRPAKCP